MLGINLEISINFVVVTSSLAAKHVFPTGWEKPISEHSHKIVFEEFLIYALGGFFFGSAWAIQVVVVHLCDLTVSSAKYGNKVVAINEYPFGWQNCDIWLNTAPESPLYFGPASQAFALGSWIYL